MADVYVINGSTLTAIADSIRAKTGTTEKLSPSAMPAAIEGISGGGGGSAEGCVTVTFMNGDEVLFTRPVYIGDDCPDPITQGHISTTPTKESTVQYNYTYSGWSLTNGGGADSTALANVTEDRVVYAAFTATARKYTITYYDDDGVTVLNTQQVAYGTVPSYTPSKEGVAFDKWAPTPVAVTGDASYTASWSSILASGTVPTDTSITWSISTSGLLKIVGTGSNILTHTAWNSMPWYNYTSQITAVVVEGIGQLRDRALKNLSKAVTIQLPNTLTHIGHSGGGSDVFDGAFDSSSTETSVNIPASVIFINSGAFAYCYLDYATFEDPNGWTLKRSGYDDVTDLDLTDPATAAKYLTTTPNYRTYTWTKSS